MRKKISLSVIQTIIDIIDGFLRVSLIEWIVVITIIAIAFPPKSKYLDQPREKHHPVKQIASIQPYFYG
ncbi:MAG: hypothetical protein LBU34_14305, partial [Planctomycetaceae bacterium]|jgi:hypothetical protein|nr:hypothetical protein [Planctomycetaceae bacterium]